jgi:hypothetical protein
MQRKKRTFIQVSGNPRFAQFTVKPSPATAINNPRTGQPLFGMFPSINTQHVTFVGGPIYLRYGRHFGTNQGFGFEHIWQARFPTCSDLKTATALVADLIASILTKGATIHYEFGTGNADRRSTVFKSKAGVVIVEERLDGNNDVFYSIVTAFEAPKANGPVIGSL